MSELLSSIELHSQTNETLNVNVNQQQIQNGPSNDHLTSKNEKVKENEKDEDMEVSMDQDNALDNPQTKEKNSKSNSSDSREENSLGDECSFNIPIIPDSKDSDTPLPMNPQLPIIDETELTCSTTEEAQLNQLRDKEQGKEKKNKKKANETRTTQKELRKQKQIQQKIERERREKEENAKYEGVQIIENLYLGGRLVAQNLDWIMEKMGQKTHILNVTSELKNYHSNSSFTYMKIPIADSMDVDISKHFEGACLFIDSAFSKQASVLVHCKEGKSRSLTIIIAYLMMRKGWSLEQAYKHVLSVLPWKENINQGFKVQLMNLDLKKEGKEELTWQFYDKRSRRKSSNVNVNYTENIDDKDEIEESQEESSDGSFDAAAEKKKLSSVKKTKQKQKKVIQLKMESFESYWKLLTGEQREGKILKASNTTTSPTSATTTSPTSTTTTSPTSTTTTPTPTSTTTPTPTSASASTSSSAPTPATATPGLGNKEETKKRKRTPSQDPPRKKTKAAPNDDSEKENKSKVKKKSSKMVKSPRKTPQKKKEEMNFHTKDIMSYFLPQNNAQ